MSDPDEVRLTDLEPQFVRSWVASASPGWKRGWTEVDSIWKADGVHFLCPTCFAQNGGPVGTHLILCWTPEAPKDMPPGPGSWSMSGTGYNDLTLSASSSSICIPTGCKAHFFVRDGEIVPC